jgi:Domain of unknown function (DUF6457)
MDVEPPESDLLGSLASALSGSDPHSTAMRPLEPRDRALLLRIARDIAHATERQNAPLASYLIGRFVQVAVASGGSEPDALEHAAAIVKSLVGEAPA